MITAMIILIALFLAKAVTLGALLWLPSSGVDQSNVAQATVPYHHYKSAQKFNIAMVKSEPIKTVSAPQSKVSDLILKGIYEEDGGGFIIIAAKNKPLKSKLIGIGEMYGGYTLRQIGKQSVVLERDGKEYSLSMDIPKLTAEQPNELVSIEEGKVKRTKVSRYLDNLQRVAGDIGVVDHTKGVEISFLKRNSLFWDLGLQKGDILREVNGKKIRTMESLVQVYKTMQKSSYVNVVVLRDGKEEELEYEIY
jgi:general secretion pathway protein C